MSQYLKVSCWQSGETQGLQRTWFLAPAAVLTGLMLTTTEWMLAEYPGIALQ